MSTIKFEVGQIFKSRAGDEVRIICTDAKISPEKYDIVALIKCEDGTDFIEWYRSRDIKDGYLYCFGDDDTSKFEETEYDIKIQ